MTDDVKDEKNPEPENEGNENAEINVPDDKEEETGEEEGSEKEDEPEAWLLAADADDDEAEQTEADDPAKIMPVKKHVKVKHKLKAKIEKRDDEISRLKAENEALKAGGQPAQPEAKAALKRPRLDDFETEDDYNNALDDYYDARADARYDSRSTATNTQRQQQKVEQQIDQAVTSHYDRANDLIEKHGIKPDVYKESDHALREAAEKVYPGAGDNTINAAISIVGKGSEKVMYAIRRNPALFNEFKSLLATDKTGFKTAAFLGAQKQRLLKPTKPRSTARKPAPTHKGDAPTGSVSTLKNQYDSAIKKGDTQAAYNAKKAAKAAKADVSKW